MRFLRLDFRDELSSIDLHPLINVVAGLEPNLQRELIKAMQTVAGGSTVGLRGLVEHQGLLVELNTDPDDRLSGATATGDVVVYVDRPGGLNELVGLQAEIDRWERQVAIDVVTVEEVRADLDPGVKARAADLLGVRGERAADESSARRARIASVQSALNIVYGLERRVRYCEPEVMELIREWDAYAATVDRHADHIQALDDEVLTAEAGLARAKSVLEHAEAAAVPIFLTAEEEVRLEELCDSADDSSKLGRLLGGGQANEAELEAEKQGLLDKVGVNSWTEYSMFRLSPTPPKERVAVVDRAKGELQAAEEGLRSARWKQKTDAVASELTQELRRIKDAASPYLDPVASASIGDGLRAQVEVRDNPQWNKAVDQLRSELSLQGVRPEVGLDPDDLVGWTADWLRTQQELDQQQEAPAQPRSQDEIERERAEARSSLLRHRRALARIGAVEQAASRSAARLSELRQLYARRESAPEPTAATEILAMVEPVVDQAVSEMGSSIPVIVVGEFPGISAPEVHVVMAGLESLSAKAQIILLSERGEIADWVAEVGLERAGTTAGTKALV